MPWTNKQYPASMKNLPKQVREKAIEIANALLDETSMNEGIGIATAISRAKDWAANRGKPIRNKRAASRTTDVKKHGSDRYVVPHGDEWAVKTEGNKRVDKIFPSKTEAVKRARKQAREANASVTIQKKTGRVQSRSSYNPARKSARQKTK